MNAPIHMPSTDTGTLNIVKSKGGVKATKTK